MSRREIKQLKERLKVIKDRQGIQEKTQKTFDKIGSLCGKVGAVVSINIYEKGAFVLGVVQEKSE